MSGALTGDRELRMALGCAVDGGDAEVTSLVTQFGAAAAWDAVASGRLGRGRADRAGLVDLEPVAASAASCGARFVVPGEEEWPEQLGDLEHCVVGDRGGVPIGLWLRGPATLAELSEAAVAVVGARASTSYGDTVATDLGADLAEERVAVVSGGAYGIDAAAHRGALAARGPTLAVLATGVDQHYPRGNTALLEGIARNHLVVSELPPGSTPTRVRFLARNRIIAALAQGTVVVEAALRSGARNTATWTLECGRQLMAVPGPVHSALSETPHALIREQNATLVTRAAEVLELVAPLGTHLLVEPTPESRPTDGLSARGLAVFEAVPARGGAATDEVALASGVGIGGCLAELGALAEAGLVVRDDRGWRLGAR